MRNTHSIRPNASPTARRRADCVLEDAVRGFTLLELTLVLAIVSVFSGVVVLSYGRALAGYRADAAAERVATDIRLTQTKARGMSTSRAIIFSTGTNSYGILDEPGATNPAQSYLVNLGADPLRVERGFHGVSLAVLDADRVEMKR